MSSNYFGISGKVLKLAADGKIRSRSVLLKNICLCFAGWFSTPYSRGIVIDPPPLPIKRIFLGGPTMVLACFNHLVH